MRGCSFLSLGWEPQCKYASFLRTIIKPTIIKRKLQPIWWIFLKNKIKWGIKCKIYKCFLGTIKLN